MVLAACFGACGGGGSGTGSSGNGNTTGAAYGAVLLQSHSPDDLAVQVPVDAAIVLEFDASMALDSFGDEDTWLRKVDTTANLPGTFARSGVNRVSFTPAAALELETDYQFQLSALTCDDNGRILDRTVSFTFRTFDATPPQVLGLDVLDNSINQSRTRSYAFTFSEAIGAASITETSLYLRDSFNIRYPSERTIDGAHVTLRPLADLPGDRQFYLVASTGCADRAGNHLAATSQTRFRTIADADTPSVQSAWPTTGSTGVSPLVQPTFTFSESMDPASVEAASLLFQDQFGSIVPFAIESSRDQRTLRLRPTVTLQSNRNYTMAFLLGGAGATDVSGNTLSSTQPLTFRTGTDAEPPKLVSSSPATGETRVPGSVVLELDYDEALDPAWINDRTVTLTAGGEAWLAAVEQPSPNTLRVTPALPLEVATTAVLTVHGGPEGVRDLAGNVLAQDLSLSFTTSDDAGLPRVMILPPDGATAVAPSSHVTILFDAPMDASTLTSTNVLVLTDLEQPLPGQMTITGGDRVVTFTPTTPLAALTYYRVRVVGGKNGARRTSGNWFEHDENARFRTGSAVDSVPPSVTASLNGIQSSRLAGLVVPTHGFSIEVTTGDTQNQWVDMGSIDVQLQGTGSAPGAVTLLAAAVVDFTTFRVTVPEAAALTEGDWTMTVHASDLSGNVGSSPPLTFSVAQPTAALVPFERTQVVWVRTDLDRDDNGQPDFDDDLVRLGLNTPGDPRQTNARMRNLLLDGILAQSNHLYGRGSRGEPLDSGSVGLRFTKRQPVAVPHMQMSLGGLDPEGSRQRTYGNESTGVLGRAYFDYRNGVPNERNTSTSPGLGVFPAEMWLYQTNIHLQVWPSFQTAFAQRFRPLCADMGGTPVGSHELDAVVLAPGFDYATATTQQRARWQTIMDAADDWATVIGIILAHEVGHSVGLVAPGAMPTGLYGDSSLHNTFAGAAEVMAPSVGYEAMISLDYHFRDLDLAYLRQRALLR